MIRNPDASEGQPRTMFTAPPVQYDNSKFIPVPVKKGLHSYEKKNPKFDFTFIMIKIWLYILNCSFLLLVCPQAAITSLSGSHHFLFFLVYVRYLIPSSPLYFVHVQAAWWSFTERWFTRVNTTSRTSPGRSTPSTCLIKRTPPTASRTGGYKTYAKPC